MNLYLTPTINHWACDLEADNLKAKATTIYCAWLVNLISKEKVFCRSAADFQAFQEKYPDGIYVGHNFIAYDAPMLNKFWGGKIKLSKIVDTFVLSQLYNPSYSGGHSLAAWGQRLRFPKTEFSDFSQYTREMAKYCLNDTLLTALLFTRLTERMRQVNFSERGCEIEHRSWNIIQNKQVVTGFPFNKEKAMKLYVHLRQREEELKHAIYELWPPSLEIVGEFAKAYKRDGSHSALYLRHVGQFPKLELRPDGSYVAYDYVAFNLGSPVQRIEKLLALGWKPVNKTKKGNPKIDEDELLAFAESSGQLEIASLAKWIVINSRANMVKTWLDAYDEETKSIHGRIFLASTLRYRHNSPNSANIPAVRQKKVDGKDVVQYGEDGAYSYETRDLWDCGDGEKYDLVGIDGTGIQNRCLIHSLIKTVGEEAVADFKKLALSGDVHNHNISVLGLANKAAAKKFYYTLMMGGGGSRLAADQAQFGTVMTAKHGDMLKNKMIDSMPGFGDLIKALVKELEETGRIKLCDGTPVLVPSPHMVIPYLLQGDESRLMKQASIYVDEGIRKNRWNKYIWKVADIHDEWQYKTAKEVTDEFISMALPCFNLAGDSFDYRIPIDGDAKVGKTWAETH